MALKTIRNRQRIQRIMRRMLSLTLAGMLTFSSVNIETMAANKEADAIDLQSAAFMSENEDNTLYSGNSISENMDADNITAGSDMAEGNFSEIEKEDSSLVTEVDSEENISDESKTDEVIDESKQETVDESADKAEIGNESVDESEIRNESEDDMTDADADADADVVEVIEEDESLNEDLDSLNGGALGDAVSFDENGNLVIETESIDTMQFSDEEILEYIGEELLFGSSDSISITFNMKYEQSTARDMLPLVNNLRKPDKAWYLNSSGKKEWNKKLKPLTYDYDLEKVAMLRAAESALRFAHERLDGTKCWTAYDETGYTGYPAGENLAAGYSSTKDTFKQWEEANQPYALQGHRRNMLSSDAVSIGIGHVIFNGYHFWSQEFAYSNENATPTKALDGNAPVSTRILPSLISKKSISFSKASETIVEGGSCTLPVMKLSITVAGSWPSAATIKGSTKSIRWVVPSEYSDIITLTGEEDGETYTVTASDNAAKGKEINEIKLKAKNGSTSKDFTINIKCEHELEDITIPATLYSNGTTGKRCTRCTYTNFTTIKKVDSIAQSKSSAIWNGVDIRPVITVKNSDGKVVPKECYTVTIRNAKGIDVDAVCDDGESIGCIEPGVYKIRVESVKSEGEERKNDKYDFAKELTFNIYPKAITAKNVTVALDSSNADLYFVGYRVCPKLNVTDKGLVIGKDSDTDTDLYYRLEEGKDYIVEYAANSSVGTATAAIVGIGNYAGTRSLKYTIKAATFGDADIEIGTKNSEIKLSGTDVRSTKGQDLAYSYTGATIKPSVKIVVDLPDMDGNPVAYELTEGKDYTVSYKNSKAAYTYTEGQELFSTKIAPSITITGKGNFKSAGTIKYYFPIYLADISKATTNDIYLAYTGKVKKPNPVMYGEAGKVLVNKTDYRIAGYCKIHEEDNEKAAGDIDSGNYNLETESILPLEAGRYVIICKGIKNFAGSSIAVPFTIADKGQKPMSKLKYSVGNVVFPIMVPDSNAVKVIDENTKLKGYYYELKGTEATEMDIIEGAVDELNSQSIEADYIYYVKDNDKAGKATICFVAVPGKGYVGSYKRTYNISGIAISKVTINNFKTSMVYDGTRRTQIFGDNEEQGFVYLKYAPKGKEPVVLNYDGTDETKSDYRVSYSYSKGANVGTVTVTIKGNPQKGYTGSVKKKFKIKAKKLSVKEIVKPETEMIIDGQVPFVRLKSVGYTGAVTTPRPVICYVPGGVAEMSDDMSVEDIEGAMTLRVLEDYTLSYSNNTKRASAIDKKCPSVTIKGKGNYTGSIKLTYSISNEDIDGNIFVSVKGHNPESETPGDGSISNPFATLQAAVDVATPGSTIYLRGGTYKGSTVIKDFCEGVSEEASASITITNFPGEKVNLYGVKKSDKPVIRFDDGAHNVVISGLNIGNFSSKWAYGIKMVTTGEATDKGIHDIVIENNNIFGLITNNESSGGASGIQIIGRSITNESAIRNVVIKNNKIHDNVNAYSENISVAGNCENVIVSGNKVYKNTNIGIDLFGNKKGDTYCQNPALNQPRNCVIANNVVYNCVSKYSKCAGIYVDGAHGDTYETGIRIIGNEVYNNVYGIEVGSEKWCSDYGSGPDAIGEDGVDHRVKNITIEDNYIHNNSSGGIRVGGYTRAPEDPSSESSMTGWVVDCQIIGNLLVNNGSGTGGNNGEIHFSKCDNITVSGNTIVQGILNRKYPVYAYDWGDNNLPMEEKNWATNINIE